MNILLSFNFIIGVLIASVVFIIFNFFKKIQRENQLKQEKEKAQKLAEKYDIKDTDNQLRFINAVELKPKKLMNREEYRIFSAIENHIQKNMQAFRVMSQVNLGEVIATVKDSSYEPGRTRAHASFNSKRVDILIIDPFGEPRIAIEYQGKAHFQGNAEGRDAVKKRALQKAGIMLIEIYHHDEENMESYLKMIEQNLKVGKNNLADWRNDIRAGKI